MNSSLNNEPKNEKQAYHSLLKNNIQPTDKFFSARVLLNNLSAVDKYLLDHAITFEETHVINHSDDWDFIRPQTAFNYNSLQGLHAPKGVASNGVVFTFNQNDEGVWQLVFSTQGLAYRKIGSTWDYIGQGIPGDVNIHALIDQHRLDQFRAYIEALYASKGDLRSATNSQEVINYHNSNTVSSGFASASHNASSLSSNESLLSSSTDYQLHNPKGAVNQLRNNVGYDVNSLEQTNRGEVNDIYNNFVPSYTTSTVTSLTGSFIASSGGSNFSQYSSGIYAPGKVQQSMVSMNGTSNMTPGSVYLNASLIDSVHSNALNNYHDLSNSVDLNVAPSLKNAAISLAYSYATSDIKDIEENERGSYFSNPNYNNGSGSVYINASNIASLNNQINDNNNGFNNTFASLSASASSDAEVTQVNSYTDSKPLLSVSNIQVNNGPAILGNGYTTELANPESNWDSTSTSIIAHATQLTTSATNSYDEYLSSAYDLVAGQNVSYNSDMASSAAAQSGSGCDEARSTDLSLINSARASAGVAPVQFAYENQVVADLRVPALRYVYHYTQDHSDLTVHGEDMLKAYYLLIASALNFRGFLDSDSAENCSSWNYGVDHGEADGSHTVETYHNRTGSDAATNIMDVYLNHDGINGGHRKSILNPDYKYVGIAYFFNPITQRGVEVEDFSGNTGTTNVMPNLIRNISTNMLLNYKDYANPKYITYVNENSFPVASGNHYQLDTLASSSNSIGFTTVPYLEYYDNLFNLPEKNGVLDGRYATYLISKADLAIQAKTGYFMVNFVPKPGIDRLHVVGIPIETAQPVEYRNLDVFSTTPVNTIQKTNSLASENADNITAFSNQIQQDHSVISHFEDELDSFSQNIRETQEGTGGNQTKMILVPSKSIAASLSNQPANYSNIYTYPRYSQPTGDDSYIEEQIINWANNYLPMTPDDYWDDCTSNISRYPNEDTFSYNYRIQQICNKLANLAKDKVAAILGVAEEKSNFGADNDNYLGYRDYQSEYDNNVYGYLDNILAQTVGAWNEFRGGYTFKGNPTQVQITGINPANLDNHEQGNAYALAEWLDKQIDNSAVDWGACGSNAKNLRNLLY